MTSNNSGYRDHRHFRQSRPWRSDCDLRPGVQGLIVVVEAHPGLERRLLGFVRDLPIAKVGAWAATSCGTCFRDPVVAAEFIELLHAWGDQTENKILGVAAKGVLQMKAKKA